MHTAGTLGFYLRGTAYPNGSIVLRTDIGEGDVALQCTTDSTTCCTNMNGGVRAGEFYFPNGDTVMVLGAITNGYYRTRGTSHIGLNRRSAGTVTGQFRCEIPNASGTTVNFIINIGTCVGCYVLLITGSYLFCVAVDITVSITPVSGTNTAGETYSLECSATVTGSNDQPTITWLDDDVEISSSDATRMVSVITMNPGSSYSSTLTFAPLSASDTGTYTCRVMAESQTFMVNVNGVYTLGSSANTKPYM